MLLEGKVALVTGGGAGLGKAIAESYAREGAPLLVTDNNAAAGASVAEAIPASGGTAASGHLDTTNPQQHLDIVAEVEAKFGKLDIAANNAGITIPAVPTADLSIEDWERVRSVDLDGVFYGLKAQLPAMLRAGGGVIVTTSSIAGDRGLWGMLPYSAAKHGVIGMMKTVALEYGTQGIRALAVGPAFIKTGLEDKMPEDVRKQLPGMHAVGRMGEPREVGDTFAWLSSDQASFITGSYIPVDGGYLAR